MDMIVGIETRSGAVIAGDRTYVDDSGVRQTIDRVFEYGYAAAAAVGNRADVDEFGRKLGTELDGYETDRGAPPTIGAVARTAGRIAKAAKVEAIVLGRDEENTAEIRAVRSDGATFDDGTSAFGSGAPMALERLENVDPDDDLDEVERLVREVFSAVEARDPESGGGVRTVAFENGSDAGTAPPE